MNSTSDETDLIERSFISITITSIILALLILTTIVGNAAVIYIVRITPSLKSEKYNILIINLSITDMLSAFLVMMTSIIAVSTDIVHINSIWCNICCAMNYVLIIVSMLTMTSISIVRYIAIVHPIFYKMRIGVSFIAFLIIYSWFQGFVFAIPPVYLSWIEYDYWEAVCAINWQREQKMALFYVIFACIFCFFIPGLWITINYSLVGYQSYKFNLNKSPDSRSSAKANTILRSLVVVVLCFFICMTPFCLTKLLKVAINNSFVPGYVNLFSSCMQYCSSLVNPFIYAIFRQDFRYAFKKIFINISHIFCANDNLQNNFNSDTMKAEDSENDTLKKTLKKEEISNSSCSTSTSIPTPTTSIPSTSEDVEVHFHRF